MSATSNKRSFHFTYPGDHSAIKAGQLGIIIRNFFLDNPVRKTQTIRDPVRQHPKFHTNVPIHLRRHTEIMSRSNGGIFHIVLNSWLMRMFNAPVDRPSLKTTPFYNPASLVPYALSRPATETAVGCIQWLSINKINVDPIIY